MTAGLTRREALLVAGAGALAVAIPGFAPARGNADGARVDVVGAGLSGLACALALVQAGVDVRVWEGRDRLGGRTLTDTSLVPGRWVECGGEFIDAEHTVIRRLCADSGVTLQDLEAVDVPGVGRDLVGARVREDGWADAPESPGSAAPAARGRQNTQPCPVTRMSWQPTAAATAAAGWPSAPRATRAAAPGQALSDRTADLRAGGGLGWTCLWVTRGVSCPLLPGSSSSTQEPWP